MPKHTPLEVPSPRLFNDRYNSMDSTDLFLVIHENLTTLSVMMSSEDVFDVPGIGVSNFISFTQTLLDLAEQKAGYENQQQCINR